MEDEQYWKDFQKQTLNYNPQSLLVEFLNQCKDIKTIIDLGCGAGNDTVYMVKKGYQVTAIDKYLNKKIILNRLEPTEKDRVKFVKKDFKNLSLPKSDCIVAMFSLPFCHPSYFDKLWNNIYESLDNGGHLVCQLFGERDDFSNFEHINTFTKEEVLQKMLRYKTFLVNENEFIRESDGKKFHYFDIIATK